jgi:hypothetical protein
MTKEEKWREIPRKQNNLMQIEIFEAMGDCSFYIPNN